LPRPPSERPRDTGRSTTTDAVVRIDCHVHTRGSFDSVETVDRVLASAVDAGLDGVVVTDHDTVSHSIAAADRASACGLVGIPGVEVSTADGHVLGIGIETLPPRGRPFETTVEFIRAAGGVAVVPHPFQRSRHGVPAGTIADCDGIEVFNAHALTGLRNRQASRFAERRDHSRFAGSDAHRAESVGYAYTAVTVGTATPTREAVLDAMRDGRVRAGGERMPPLRYVRKVAGSAKRNSRRMLRAE
jgi:predicted metal-dependent phosphoesterase TrpH